MITPAQSERATQETVPGSLTIRELIQALSSSEPSARQQACHDFVAFGWRALRPLLEALADESERVRWDVARALSQMGDPATAPALVGMLEDESFAVRRLAAEALARMGLAGLPPLLHALERQTNWRLREGALFALRGTVEMGLSSYVALVLECLEEERPMSELARAVRITLYALGEGI